MALLTKEDLLALVMEQRYKAEVVARSYKHSARERARARVLLLADTNQTDGACVDAVICEQTGLCALTGSQIRQRFTENGLGAALCRAEQKIGSPASSTETPKRSLSLPSAAHRPKASSAGV